MHVINERKIFLEIITELQASNYIKSFTIGSTRPFILACGNEVFVVKAFDEESQNKHLINEFVCYHIAILLDIPIPKASLVKIDNTLLNSVSDLRTRNIKSNILFGSKLVERTQTNITPPLLEAIVNKEDIPSIILFDQIIYNNDRANNSGNLLFDMKEKKLLAIDHTHVFKDGLLWDQHTLERITSDNLSLIDNFHDKYYRMLQSYVGGNDPFNKVKNKLIVLTEENISLIIDSIPIEWGIVKSEEDALKRFLMHRISNVNLIFRRIQEQCPHWKGVI